MARVREIVSGVGTWAWFSEPHGYDFNGHLVRHPGGNVCIDPVPPDEETLATLVRERTGARTLLHPADAAYARGQGAVIDGDVASGQRIGPLVAVAVPGK